MRRGVWIGAGFSALVLAAAGSGRIAEAGGAGGARVNAVHLAVQAERGDASDLAIGRRVAAIGHAEVRYVRWADLRALPQTPVFVQDDPDLPGVRVQVEGVRLDVLAQALGAAPAVDLIDATCSDGYRAYYPREMMLVHRPILVLTMGGMRPADWARQAKQENPGPYLVLYDHFIPAWRVLAHADRPQLPTNVVRVDLETKRKVWGPIAPARRDGAAAQQGFLIARQNCIRCHAEENTGGTKSDKTWGVLGEDARVRPEWFARMVKNPKAVAGTAEMPANPEYDAPTLRALTAYFRLFHDPRELRD